MIFGIIKYLGTNLKTWLTLYSWYFTLYYFQRGRICWHTLQGLIPDSLPSVFNLSWTRTEQVKMLRESGSCPTSPGGRTGSRWSGSWTCPPMKGHSSMSLPALLQMKHLNARVGVTADLWLHMHECVNVWQEMLRKWEKQGLCLKHIFI